MPLSYAIPYHHDPSTNIIHDLHRSDLTVVTTPTAALLWSLRPPPEPPPCSSTTVKAIVPLDPDLSRPPPKPPWLICCVIYFVLLDLCFSVFVIVAEFVLHVWCVVFWLLYSTLVCIMCVCQLSFDVWNHIRCAVPYEDVPDFILFAFYQSCLIRCDMVNKIETNYSRNARDEAKKMIRNWIERKTVDSHISFVNIRGWTMLMQWLFGYDSWFKSSNFSAKFMCNLHLALVYYLSSIYSLKLLGYVPSKLTSALCNAMCFME